MITETHGIGPYCSHSLTGTVLTVAGTDYDLTALQEDAERVIDIMDGQRYLANIVIPPAKYRVEETGEGDEAETQIIKEPLEMGRVRLVLWHIGGAQ